MKQERSKESIGLLLMVALFAMNCDFSEPKEKSTQYEVTAAGLDLARQVEGFWNIRTVSYSTDCPEEHVSNPMDGHTRWTANGHRVEIKWLTGGMYIMELWATGATTLEVAKSIEMFGCILRGEASMSFKSVTGNTLEGNYREVYYHNQDRACESSVEEYDLPERCELFVQWVGYR
tara:strand:- start:181 stop:708 length:528 start_codon:yes stop_codon:yes gene_type:complete